MPRVLCGLNAGRPTRDRVLLEVTFRVFSYQLITCRAVPSQVSSFTLLGLFCVEVAGAEAAAAESRGGKVEGGVCCPDRELSASTGPCTLSS